MSKKITLSKDLNDIFLWLVDEAIIPAHSSFLERYKADIFSFLERVQNIFINIDDNTYPLYHAVSIADLIDLITNEIFQNFPGIRDRSVSDRSVLFNTIKFKMTNYYNNRVTLDPDDNEDEPPIDETVTEKVDRLEENINDIKDTLNSIEVSKSDDELTNFDDVEE